MIRFHRGSDPLAELIAAKRGRGRKERREGNEGKGNRGKKVREWLSPDQKSWLRPWCTPSNTWFPGPIQLSIPNCIRAELWHIHSRQMPIAYGIEGPKKDGCKCFEHTSVKQSVMFYAL